MNHYELLYIIHPEQGDEIEKICDKYKQIIEKSGGIIHRFENWGRRNLNFPINNVHKANYILMNIECSVQAVDEVLHNFRFNDAILRHLIFRTKKASTEISPIYAKVLAIKEEAQAPGGFLKGKKETLVKQDVPVKAPVMAKPISENTTTEDDL